MAEAVVADAEEEGDESEPQSEDDDLSEVPSLF